MVGTLGPHTSDSLSDLWPADGASVAAMILNDSDMYLMQLRESKPAVTFPGAWGFFGGSVEDGETPEQALMRELEEELSVTFDSFTFFTQIAWDLRHHGMGVRVRHIYLTRICERTVSMLELREGEGFQWMSAHMVKQVPNVIPMDQLAIALHADYIPPKKSSS